MSDPGFREFHLSGKHVVFLFMALTVGAVAVFLLGVSVGKGITQPDAATAQATPAPNGTEPAASPASTQPNKGELDYYRTLQEKGTPAPAASPAATPAALPAATPAATPSATPAPPPPAASTKPSPTPATGKPYFVLVDSFGSQKNANTRLAEVKKKGFAEAILFTAPSGPAPYKVRLGPFPDKPAADAMAARLRKEGYRPSVTR